MAALGFRKMAARLIYARDFVAKLHAWRKFLEKIAVQKCKNIFALAYLRMDLFALLYAQCRLSWRFDCVV